MLAVFRDLLGEELERGEDAHHAAQRVQVLAVAPGAKGGGRGGRSNTAVYEIVATGCVSLRAKERAERVSRKD